MKKMEEDYKIDDSIKDMAGDANSSLGSGGMITKLMAAEIGWREGTPQLRIDPRNTRMTVETEHPVDEAI